MVSQTIIGPDWMGIPQPERLQVRPEQGEATAEGRRLGRQPDAPVPVRRPAAQGARRLHADHPAAVQGRRRQHGDRQPSDGDRDYAAADNGWRLRPASRSAAASSAQDPNVSGKYMETINCVPVGGNYGHYTKPELDELFPQGRATTGHGRSARRSTPRPRRS